jgi:Fe-S oxidoreductase
METLSPDHWAAAASALLWLSVIVAASTAAMHARAWRAGYAMRTDWIAAAAKLPRRYLVDVHAVVARHRATSWMHACLAGGFLASLLAWALFPWLPGGVWVVAQALALAVCSCGVLFLGLRRLGRTPAPQKLSRGRFRPLLAAFGAYVAGSLLLLAAVATRSGGASPMAIPGLLAFGTAIVYLVAFAVFQPLRHALFGAIHIATHPKPERFSGEAASRGTAAEPARPAASAADFGWKHLLSFDACIECGRCQSACPAHASGHALNPKALIQDLARATGLRKERYAGDPHAAPGGEQAAKSPSVLGIRAETLWSCTTCAACVAECPMFIEHVDAVTSLRRHLTQQLAVVPGKLPSMLRELRENGNSHGLPGADRWSWASDLRPPLLRDVHSADVLVWAGDAAFELHGRQVLRALLQLLEAAEVSYAVLGEEELDCGHLSRRCGDEEAFLRLQARNRDVLRGYRFRTLVTPDPHAFHTLSHEYPADAWEVAHHSEFLAALADAGRLRLGSATSATRTVYHDPCYLGRHGKVYDAPRKLLQHAGRETLEAARSREKSFCCGAGGGQAWAGQSSTRSIAVIRLEELKATGASEIAVACPNCKLMFQGAADLPVKDVAEIMLEAL